jgi:hypothetical protein
MAKVLRVGDRAFSVDLGQEGKILAAFPNGLVKLLLDNGREFECGIGSIKAVEDVVAKEVITLSAAELTPDEDENDIGYYGYRDNGWHDVFYPIGTGGLNLTGIKAVLSKNKDLLLELEFNSAMKVPCRSVYYVKTCTFAPAKSGGYTVFYLEGEALTDMRNAVKDCAEYVVKG